MDPVLTLMAKPFIERLVKDIIIPKISSFCGKIEQGIQLDFIPKVEHFQEYLYRSYKKYSVINTLVQKNQQMELKEIYVPLTLKSLSDEMSSDMVLIDGFPKSFLDENHCVLITDLAGMGKSTVTKRMFLDVVDGQYGIPIFIELRRINETHDIISEIISQLNSLSKEVSQSLVLNLLQTGEFVFFFDGFDEVPMIDLSFVTRNIQDFVSKAGENNIYIMTSRPDNSLACFGNFKTMRIASLTKKQSYDLIRKLDNDGDTSKMLIEKLKSPDYKTIEEFLKNPLLVSLLFAAFNYKPSIPIKKHIFYRQVFDAYFDSHDLSKGDGFKHEKLSKLAIDDFDTVMRYLGFDCQKKEKVEFEKDELLLMIRHTKDNLARIHFQESNLLTDLLKAVPLFCRDGQFYKWTHKSLQEYFAAEFIYKDSKENQNVILTAIYQSDKFERYINLLDLYCDIDFNGFQKNILSPFLREYKSYYEANIQELFQVPVELQNERIGLLFNRKIYLWDAKEIGLDFDDEIIDKRIGRVKEHTARCIHLMGQDRIVIVDRKFRSSLIRLIVQKMPELVSRVGNKNLEYTLSHDFVPITIDTFNNNVEKYQELNLYLSFVIEPFYLNYDSIVLYLKKLESFNTDNIKSELLKGL